MRRKSGTTQNEPQTGNRECNGESEVNEVNEGT